MNTLIRIRAIGLFCCLLLTHWAFSQTTTRYVSTTGITPAASATSWATSTTDLQGAINASQPGDQVWVAAGMYKPAGGSSFSMKNSVAIYGGFAGNEQSLLRRPVVNPVIGHPSNTTLAGNGSRVITNPGGLTNTALLDGFVITGGGNVNFGGGIYNSGSSPTLINCSFLSNQATATGGALYSDNSIPTLINCNFLSNQATFGGGAIYFVDSRPVLANCNFQNNLSEIGGAISNNSRFSLDRSTSNVVLTNCNFQNNQASANGGAIGVGSVTAIATNCSFQNNQTSGGGGAVYANDCNLLFTNCVVFGNNGSNTVSSRFSTLTARYSLFENGVTGFMSDPSNLTGITTSPFAGTATTQLAVNSVARDRGDLASYTAVGGPPTDLAGNPRIVGTNYSIDMGAYEDQNGSPVSVQIVRQPPSASVVCAGISVTVSVSASGSSPSYQWYRNGSPLTTNTSATSATLILSNVSTNDEGNYSVVVTGGLSVTSTSFALTVNEKPSLSVTSNPSDLITCVNPTLTLTATSSATALLWPTGETTATIAVSTTGVYSVTATGSNGCTAVSNSLTITQDKISPTVSVSALSTTLTCVQPQLTLTATSSATALLWSTGETTTTIAVSTTGVYSVTATGSNGCTAVSNSLTISRDNTSPTVSVSALSSTLTCTQPQLTLTATASATALLWSTGETATTIAVSTTGVYSVTATGSNGCTAVSNNLTIAQDKTSPTVSISAASTTLTCTQPQLTLTATASTIALRWSTGQTTTTISVSQTGTYSVTATGANGCAAVSKNLPVTENFSLPPFTVSSATVCPGQSVNLTASGCSGLVLWPNGATGSVIILTAGSSTSLLTATCTVGSCSTTASGQIAIGGIQPPPAQILSFTADGAACPVRLTGRGVATSFTMTGPKDYVFSTVYREGATHEAVGLNVKQAGTYTLTATYTNSCGTSAPVTRTVTVNQNCP